ncbi:MAG: MBG domain-containing protein, partial [Limisphaerales bacterium]
ALSYTVSGLQFSDTAAGVLTGALARAAGEAVGGYAITQGSLAPNANYTISFTGNTLTISPAALDITANNDSKTYGQTKSYGAGQTGFTSSGLQNGETIGSVTITASGGTAATAAVGSYTLTPSAATGGTFTSSNYSITYHNGTLTVNALAVLLAGSRLYDGTATAAASILSVANPVGSDVVTVASGSATLVSADVGAQAITSVGTLALGGPAAGNYTLAGASGVVTITASGSSLTVGASANPSLAGSNVTFTATVAPVAPASTTPTGNVQFYTNGVASGSPVPLGAGVASFSTTNLPAGTNMVAAVYAGNGNFLGTSNSLVQVVYAIGQTPSTVGIKNNGDGSVTVSFSGTPGAQYIVQAKSDLAPATAWDNVSTSVAGTNGQWTFTESMEDHPIRFYRALAP